MKNKIKIILILILLILISLIITFYSKFYKVNEIINLMKINSNKDNYSYSVQNHYDKERSEKNIKRNKMTVINSVLEEVNIYDYYDFKNNISCKIDDISKIYFKREIIEVDKDLLIFPFYQYLTLDYSFKNKLKLVFDWKIKSKKDYYEILTKDNYKITFNKKTGLVTRVENLDLNKRFDHTLEDYKENCVTDEETKLPDLSDYQEVLD